MTASTTLSRSRRPGVSARQLRAFETDGYVIVRQALSEAQLCAYRELHERIYREELAAGRLAPAGGRSNRPGAMHAFGFVIRDHAYLELLDLPTTFPLIRAILGWNIYMYHSHIDQHPPLHRSVPPVWAWHQDGGRQNVEIETQPTRPRLSVKVAFFLSDVSEPGRGNLKVIPGSHHRNELPRDSEPPGAIQLCVPPGAAVIFDRRLWHSRSDNLSDVTRKALFMGYTYRWIRPRDDLAIDWGREPFRSLSPVRKQLLGWGQDAMSFWAVGDDDIPLQNVCSE